MTLREVYNKYFHPEVLPIEESQYWEALQNGSVLNVFQFDSDVGAQAAKKVKPSSIIEMSDANGLTLSALTHFTGNHQGAQIAC